jgi:hypothetical protein
MDTKDKTQHIELGVFPATAASSDLQSIAKTESFQNRVQPWMMACFGPVIAADKEERNDRFLEEALELVQSGNYTRERAYALVDYVFSRPVGEKRQEVGGVMVTLAAWCLANEIDMHECGEEELTRIWTVVEKIREKQKSKPRGSALPQAQEYDFEKIREEFEAKAYMEYFMNSISFNPNKQFADCTAKPKNEWMARNENGDYEETTLNAAWWGWKTAMTMRFPVFVPYHQYSIEGNKES